MENPIGKQQNDVSYSQFQFVMLMCESAINWSYMKDAGLAKLGNSHKGLNLTPYHENWQFEAQLPMICIGEKGVPRFPCQ